MLTENYWIYNKILWYYGVEEVLYLLNVQQPSSLLSPSLHSAQSTYKSLFWTGWCSCPADTESVVETGIIVEEYA